jgi:hypothetical protein
MWVDVDWLADDDYDPDTKQFSPLGMLKAYQWAEREVSYFLTPAQYRVFNRLLDQTVGMSGKTRKRKPRTYWYGSLDRFLIGEPGFCVPLMGIKRRHLNAILSELAEMRLISRTHAGNLCRLEPNLAWQRGMMGEDQMAKLVRTQGRGRRRRESEE